jgi:tripartite-type tricarboxylate transporter receptor subunit TctC
MNRKQDMRPLLAHGSHICRAVGNAVPTSLQHVLLITALFTPHVASAQPYPNRLLTLVTSVPAGGSIDAVARIIAAGLGPALGENVIVEARPGAGGNIAAAYVANAPADGHVLLIASSSTLTTNPHFYKSLPFDPIRSFAPIIIPARVNMVLVVHPKLNVSTAQEFIQLLRAKPRQLNFGSGGNGTQSHLAAEIFGVRTATQATHIPYRGIAPARVDLLAGQTDFMFDSATSVPHIRAGKLRALAVVGPNRVPALTDVPTFAELGIRDMEIANGWYAVATTAGTPRETVQRLNTETVKILKLPSTKEAITAMGLDPATSTPDEMADALKNDLERLESVVKRIGNTSQADVPR